MGGGLPEEYQVRRLARLNDLWKASSSLVDFAEAKTPQAIEVNLCRRLRAEKNHRCAARILEAMGFSCLS